MSNNNNDDHIDDLDLFRKEMAGTQPLEVDKRLHQKEKPTIQLLRQQYRDQSRLMDPVSDMATPPLVANEEYLEYRGPGIQHRTFAKLRSGKIHIEAELDLHGMTLATAEPALAQFLSQCQQQAIRYVRIVHGKGWSSKDNKPILKSTLNYWLRESRLVLAFCSATVDDGGTGALYVLIKRINNLA